MAEAVHHSMTGFGRGQLTTAAGALSIEIKSVNQRFLDVTVRLPRRDPAIERAVQKAVRAALARGRVEVFVRLEERAEEGRLAIDGALVRGLVGDLREIAGDHLPEEALWRIALQRPEAVQRRAPVGLEEDDLLGCLSQAIAALLESRRREGDALVAELRTLAGDLQRLRVEVAELAAEVPALLTRRLQERIDQLLGEQADPQRIAQEAAIQADKADVREELTRLDAHLVEWQRTLDRDGPAGRRLEFLLQEMNREVNTLGSKSPTAALRARVVELKSTLERLREQVLNLE